MLREPIQDAPIDAGSEQLDEGDRESAQERITAHREPHVVHAEQRARGHRDQTAVVRRVVAEPAHDAHAEAEPDIGLDHVGVDRGQYHVGLQPRVGEGPVDAAAAGEFLDVGDERMPDQRLQRQRPSRQRMLRGHDRDVFPFERGYRHQPLGLLGHFGGDREVGFARDHRLRDLPRASCSSVSRTAG